MALSNFSMPHGPDALVLGSLKVSDGNRPHPVGMWRVGPSVTGRQIEEHRSGLNSALDRCNQDPDALNNYIEGLVKDGVLNSTLTLKSEKEDIVLGRLLDLAKKAKSEEKRREAQERLAALAQSVLIEAKQGLYKNFVNDLRQIKETYTLPCTSSPEDKKKKAKALLHGAKEGGLVSEADETSVKKALDEGTDTAEGVVKRLQAKAIGARLQQAHKDSLINDEQYQAIKDKNFDDLLLALNGIGLQMSNNLNDQQQRVREVSVSPRGESSYLNAAKPVYALDVEKPKSILVGDTQRVQPPFVNLPGEDGTSVRIPGAKADVLIKSLEILAAAKEKSEKKHQQEEDSATRQIHKKAEDDIRRICAEEHVPPSYIQTDFIQLPIPLDVLRERIRAYKEAYNKASREYQNGSGQKDI